MDTHIHTDSKVLDFEYCIGPCQKERFYGLISNLRRFVIARSRLLGLKAFRFFRSTTCHVWRMYSNQGQAIQIQSPPTQNYYWDTIRNELESNLILSLHEFSDHSQPSQG